MVPFLVDPLLVGSIQISSARPQPNVRIAEKTRLQVLDRVIKSSALQKP